MGRGHAPSEAQIQLWHRVEDALEQLLIEARTSSKKLLVGAEAPHLLGEFVATHPPYVADREFVEDGCGHVHLRQTSVDDQEVGRIGELLRLGVDVE